LQVVVVDANDNSPQFERSSYNIAVSESSAVGTSLLRLHAHDPDLGHNGAVIYRLIAASSPASQHQHHQQQHQQQDQQDAVPFSVDNLTGVVSVIAPLDFEQHQTYQLTAVLSILPIYIPYLHSSARLILAVGSYWPSVF